MRHRMKGIVFYPFTILYVFKLFLLVILGEKVLF